MRFAYLMEPPFNYRTQTGNVTGCDVELARTILNRVGFNEVDFIETEFSRLLPGLEDNRWDMTTGLFDTVERRKIAAFSRPIWALPDGLLVRKGNPKKLTGYASAAANPDSTMVAIRDQLQHRATIEAHVPESRIIMCETYDEAMQAVLDGRADAYASVAMAHTGFLAQHPHFQPALDVIAISPSERPAAAGAFGFRLADIKLRNAVNAALADYLGSDDHRAMMQRFGFTDKDINLVAPKDG